MRRRRGGGWGCPAVPPNPRLVSQVLDPVEMTTVVTCHVCMFAAGSELLLFLFLVPHSPMVHLILGNTASPAKDGKRYKWTFYVRGATEYLDSVTIKLHPTFKDPVRTCEAAPFEFTSRGPPGAALLSSCLDESLICTSKRLCLVLLRLGNL